jgi:D-alanine transaminase
MTARRSKPRPAVSLRGVSVITVPDIRWKRCDIKSVSLLPNILGKQAASEAGAYEALQVDEDGFITEGTSSNAWIVTGRGDLITRKPDNAILDGVTRRAVAELAEREGLNFIERAFTLKQALAAREVFVTSTSSNVMPVVKIDDQVVGDGKPGPLSRKLLKLYATHAAGG